MTSTLLPCPVCAGSLIKTFDRGRQSRYVCEECGCDLTVPQAAWALAERKREQRWLAKDYRRWWQRRPGQETP